METKCFQTDLTPELARLMIFSANVATAIRMYSAYKQSSNFLSLLISAQNRQRHRDALNDLMWLSNCLHNFDRLGRAICEGEPGNIISACDFLLNTFKEYQAEGSHLSNQAKPTFDRNARHFSLQEGINILNDIRAIVFINL